MLTLKNNNELEKVALIAGASSGIGKAFAQKMMMAVIPIIPKKMLLGQIRKMQEVNNGGGIRKILNHQTSLSI